MNPVASLGRGISPQIIAQSQVQRHSRPFRGTVSTTNKPTTKTLPKVQKEPVNPNQSLIDKARNILSESTNLSAPSYTILTLVEKTNFTPDFEGLTWKSIGQIAAHALGAVAVGYTLYAMDYSAISNFFSK